MLYSDKAVSRMGAAALKRYMQTNDVLGQRLLLRDQARFSKLRQRGIVGNGLNPQYSQQALNP